jgi:CDP-6-deoxy-D-xylo-4-hexulose-3-dehydrase
MYYELASSSWGEEEIQAMHRVIAGGMFTMGENVRRFEAAFAQKFGTRHALMVSSGSTANLVGVAALFYRKARPLRRGDEVIVPAISWSTTYYPLQQYGLRLRFVDVELDTLNLDVGKLEAALTPRMRMVVAVSILGNPCALDVMRAFGPHVSTLRGQLRIDGQRSTADSAAPSVTSAPSVPSFRITSRPWKAA